MDELIGRQYERKMGLNEPLIVIERRNGYLLVDGHHRIMAAKRLGMKTFKAIVLTPNDFDVKIGLEKTAERWGLHSLDDVKIIEGSKHPFMEITTMLLPSEEADGINQRLMDSVKELDGPKPTRRRRIPVTSSAHRSYTNRLFGVLGSSLARCGCHAVTLYETRE